MAAPFTYTPEQREAIIELRNEQGLTVRQIQATLAAGHGNLEPFQPSTATIAAIAKEAAPSLIDEEPAKALDTLTRRSLATIDKYVAGIEKHPANFDPDDMLKIMRTLVEAKGLVQPKRTKDKGDNTGLLGGMNARDIQTAPSKQTSSAAVPVTTPAAHKA